MNFAVILCWWQYETEKLQKMALTDFLNKIATNVLFDNEFEKISIWMNFFMFSNGK